MKGTVIAVNQQKGFIAVQLDGGITVIELLGGYEVSVGDIICGNLEDHGGETLRNVTENEDMDAYIQGVHCSPQNAKNLMA